MVFLADAAVIMTKVTPLEAAADEGRDRAADPCASPLRSLSSSRFWRRRGRDRRS